MEFVEPMVTLTINVELMAPFGAINFTQALFQMKPLKFLGLDDMSFLFYKKY